MAGRNFLPGFLFIGSLVVGMYALAQGMEIAKKKSKVSFPPPSTQKKTLEELIAEMKRQHPVEDDYDMKEI